jgi:DNA polymerase-3 subunit alpha
MADKDGKADAQPFHLVLLAVDTTGCRSLCLLVTDVHIDGYYYKPRIDREHLRKAANQSSRRPNGGSPAV